MIISLHISKYFFKNKKKIAHKNQYLSHMYSGMRENEIGIGFSHNLGLKF